MLGFLHIKIFHCVLAGNPLPTTTYEVDTKRRSLKTDLFPIYTEQNLSGSQSRLQS